MGVRYPIKPTGMIGKSEKDVKMEGEWVIEIEMDCERKHQVWSLGSGATRLGVWSKKREIQPIPPQLLKKAKSKILPIIGMRITNRLLMYC